MRDALAFAARLFGGAIALAWRDWRTFLALFAVLSLAGLAIDAFLDEQTGAAASVALSGLFAYAQLLVTFRTLWLCNAAPPNYLVHHRTEARLPSMIALGFLSGVPILVGLLLLAVPGLVLALLWSLTVPALAAERLGVSDAMRRSWAIARPNLGRLAMTGLVFVVVVALVIGLVVLNVAGGLKWQWLDLVLSDGAMPALQLISASVWTLAYLDLRNAAVDE